MSLYSQINNDFGSSGYYLGIETEESGNSQYYIFCSGSNATDDDAVFTAIRDAVSGLDTGYTITGAVLAKEDFTPHAVA